VKLEFDLQKARSDALDELLDGFVLVDSDGTVLDTNPTGRALLAELGSADHIEEPRIRDLLAGSVPSEVELSVRDASSVQRDLDVRCFHPGSWPSSVRALVIRDMTTVHAFEQHQSMLANYDSLTGLPNRRMFEKQLAAALEQAEAKGGVLALLLLDLDHFKQINDSMGHAAGDELLASVAQSIRGVVRGHDVVSRLGAESAKRNIARLGGDEFAIILSDVARSEDSTDIAARVLLALRKPVELVGTPVVPSASIGVAVYPEDAGDAASLTVAADQALYKAKELGRNQCQLYHTALNDRASRRRDVARELAKAIEGDSLEVTYQPIVGLRDGEVRDAEALVRWSHETLGDLPPNEFVDIAEKTGLVDRLGRWVLDRVLQDIAKYAEGGSFDARVAVNISSVELKNPRYGEQVKERLEAHGVSPRCLQLEITERAFLARSETVARNLRAVRALGVSVHLDDFGTGRSSLSDLLEHELDGVKVDRVFVRQHQSDRVASGVLRAILQMARELRIHAVAQGVETADEAASLKRLGCEEGQGFYFSRGVEAHEYFAVVGKPFRSMETVPL